MRLLNRYKQILLFVLLILVWGCSAHKNDEIPKSIRKLKNLTVIPADAKPANQITFKKDAVYGNSKNVLIGRIGGIDIDDSGRVFIADSQKMAIDVFDSSGHYKTHFGRKGRGPGEFESITLGYPFHIFSGKIYIWDPRLFRINVFSLKTLKLSSIRNINTKYWNNVKELRESIGAEYIRSVWNDSTFLVGFDDMKAIKEYHFKHHTKGVLSWYYLMDNEGKIISKCLFEQDFPQPGGLEPLGDFEEANRQTLFTISKMKHLFSAWSEDFLIKEYNQKGKYLRAFYDTYKKVKLNRDSLMQNLHNSRARQEVMNVKIPPTWPALHDIKIDDQNRLWVATIVKNMKVYQWWVINQKGKLLAQFDWPRSKPIKVVKNGYMYTEETDTSSGISKNRAVPD